MYSVQHKGFSLIELMVTLTVAGILLTVGLPSFSDFIKQRRINEQRDVLYASLMLARSEAVNRGLSVSVCLSSNQTSCNTAGTGTVSWALGWMVFTDPNEDGVLDSGETVLRVVAAIDGGNSLEWDNGRLITYDNEGGADRAGTFTICDSDNDLKFARAVIVSSSGRVRRDTSNASGGALVCN